MSSGPCSDTKVRRIPSVPASLADQVCILTAELAALTGLIVASTSRDVTTMFTCHLKHHILYIYGVTEQIWLVTPAELCT